jgi:cell shape-determining protein MreC
MLIRISLIIAIVAGLATAGISFIKVKEKIETVKTDRNTERGLKETAQQELADTRGTLAKTEKDLKNTKSELADTQQERDKAVADATTQSRRATQLSDELAKTKTERDNAQAELAAWAALGIPVEQVKLVIAQLKQLQEERLVLLDEKKILMAANAKLDNELKLYRDPSYKVLLPPNLRGTVLVTDPKWDFVVLNVGEDQGVLEHGELLVNRDGKLVAKIVVRTVQKGRSIANVLPGWKLGDVTEGDQVIPAHPAS